MRLLDRVIEFARNAHAGQKDKGGADYIEHPLRVMGMMNGREERIVAVLHDVIEDAGVDRHDLLALGVSPRAVEAIETLTRRKGESYGQFIDRCAANEIARVVKIADLKDNMNPARLDGFTKADRDRVVKYADALEFLCRVKPA